MRCQLGTRRRHDDANFRQHPELSNREFKTAEKIAGYLKSLGMPKGMDPEQAPPHHTPTFHVDDSGLKLGVRALTFLTLDYLQQQNSKQENLRAF